MHSVIIPCFDRPEYLYVCLELLKKCDGAEKHMYLFALDQGYQLANIGVIEKFPFQKRILYVRSAKYKGMKQSFNLLNAYSEACEETDKYVYLIEDDIFCGKSFFTWHEQAQGDIFCSIASKLNNAASDPQGMTLGVTKHSTDSVYQSLGVCFDKEVLKRYVLPHLNEDYLHNPRAYLLRHFPDHFLGGDFGEQDGLIRRVADSQELPIAYPDYPRCYHAGIWGYHREGEKVRNWTFERKVKFIYDNCFSMNKMQKYNQYNDVFITDLDV